MGTTWEINVFLGVGALLNVIFRTVTVRDIPELFSNKGTFQSLCRTS